MKVASSFVFFLLMVSPPAGVLAAESTGRRPNLVFILCDDLGFGDIGAMVEASESSGRRPLAPALGATPALDAMASRGARLTGHYTGAPVCAPARASLLLGVHQGHANIRDNQFDKALENNHNLATTLREAGYRTHAIGKWGLQGGKSMAAHPQRRGFDTYFGYIGHGAGHAHYPKEDRKPLYDGMEEVSRDYDVCYTTDLFTARAKQTIIEHSRTHPDRPFFLYLAYDTPHAKTQAPSCAFPAGDGLDGGLRWLGQAGKMINTAEGKPDSWLYPEFATATWKDPAAGGALRPWPDTMKRYATMVRRIDDGLRDLVATLAELGIDRDTLVVFSSDNGPSKESYRSGKDAEGYSRAYDPSFHRGYGPFDGIKRDVYEGGVRVGAVAYWPGTIPGGRVVSRASQFHDWMPTFCELAGMVPPARSDGVSLVSDLTGIGERPDSTIYVEYAANSRTPDYADFKPERRGARRGQMQMLRIGDLAGVRVDIHSHGDDFAIYDVVKDPGQRNNLASSLPEVRQLMKDRVLQIRRPDPTSPRPFLDSLPIPALKSPAGTEHGVDSLVFPPGLPWPGAWCAKNGAATGVVKWPGASTASVLPGQCHVFRGILRVPVGGVHVFALSSPARSILKIHDTTILDTDRGNANGEARLAAGDHPIILSVLADTKGELPTLRWSSPGTEMTPIPADLFFRLPPPP